MSTAPTRRERQAALQRLLKTLLREGKGSHVIKEASTRRGEGQLVLRLPDPRGAGDSDQRDGVSSWYFRYWDNHRQRRLRYLGRCDPAGAAGLDLDDAIFAARKLAELLHGPAGGDLETYLADQHRQKVEALAEQRQCDAQRDKTLRLLLETYVAWLDEQGKRGSAYDSRNILTNHLFDRWGDLCATPAVRVTPQALADVVRAIAKQGKTRTAGKMRSILSAAYECALNVANDARLPAAFKEFDITQNPTRGVKFKGAGIRARDGKLAMGDIGMILVLLRPERGMAAAALRVLFDLAGQRQKQLLRVGVADVDLQAGTLRQLDSKGNRTQPRVHEVPMVGRTRRHLARLVDTSKRVHSRYVFTTDRVHPLRDETLRELFRRLASKVRDLHGDPSPEYRLSDLRRTAESELSELGYSREQRGWLLSHGFSGVQARHYERVQAREQLRGMLRAWQGMLCRAERAARREIAARAAAGEARFCALLPLLHAPKEVPAVPGLDRDAAAGDDNVVPLKVVYRAELADPLLRIHDLLVMLGISASTLKRLRQTGDFPRPSLLIGKVPCWRQSMIERYIGGKEEAFAASHGGARDGTNTRGSALPDQSVA